MLFDCLTMYTCKSSAPLPFCWPQSVYKSFCYTPSFGRHRAAQTCSVQAPRSCRAPPARHCRWPPAPPRARPPSARCGEWTAPLRPERPAARSAGAAPGRTAAPGKWEAEGEALPFGSPLGGDLLKLLSARDVLTDKKERIENEGFSTSSHVGAGSTSLQVSS